MLHHSDKMTHIANEHFININQSQFQFSFCYTMWGTHHDLALSFKTACVQQIRMKHTSQSALTREVQKVLLTYCLSTAWFYQGSHRGHCRHRLNETSLLFQRLYVYINTWQSLVFLSHLFRKIQLIDFKTIQILKTISDLFDCALET